MRFLYENGHTFIQNENTAKTVHLVRPGYPACTIFAAFNISKISGTIILSAIAEGLDTSGQPGVEITLVFTNTENTDSFTLNANETISILAADISNIQCKSLDTADSNAYITLDYLYDYFFECHFD